MLQDEILTACKALTSVPVTFGPLLPEGGVVLRAAGGGMPAKYLDGNMTGTMQIIIASKSASQKTALQGVSAVHKDLTKCNFNYPVNTDWQILDISTITGPGLSDVDESGLYLFDSVIEVTYYWKEA